MKHIFFQWLLGLTMISSVGQKAGSAGSEPIAQQAVDLMAQALTVMSMLCSDTYGIELPTGANECVTWREDGQVVKLTAAHKGDGGFPLIDTYIVFFPEGAERRPVYWHGEGWFDSCPPLRAAALPMTKKESFEQAARHVLALFGIDTVVFDVLKNERAHLYQYRKRYAAQAEADTNHGVAVALLVDSKSNILAFSLADLHVSPAEKKEMPRALIP